MKKECEHKSLAYNNYYKVWNCQFCGKSFDLETWRTERKKYEIQRNKHKIHSK